MALAIIKPDAFERQLVGMILTKLEALGPILQGRMHTFSPRDCDIHYKDHIGRVYYHELVNQMRSGPSMVLEIQCPWRDLRVAALEMRTECFISQGGPKNLIHTADSLEAMIRESKYWFQEVFS